MKSAFIFLTTCLLIFANTENTEQFLDQGYMLPITKSSLEQIEYDMDTLADKSNCYVNVDGIYTYDLSTFYKQIGPVEFEDKPGYNLYYTLCGENTQNCKGSESHASIYTPIVGECQVLTTNNYFADLIDEKDYEQGFTIFFEASGAKDFDDPTKGIQFKVELKCNTHGIEFIQLPVKYNEGDITLKISSKALCNITFFNLLYSFLLPFQYFIVGFLVIIGLFLGFFGLRHTKYTVFIIGFIVFFAVAALGMNMTYLKDGAQSQTMIIVLLVTCFIAGILGGVLGKYLGEKGLAFLSGVSLGIFMGLILESFIKEKLQGRTNLYYVVVAALGLIVGGVALILKHWLIIISTSLVGGCFVTFGIVLALNPEIMKIDPKRTVFDKDALNDSNM